MSEHLEQLRFLSPKEAFNIAHTYDTPTFVYDEATYMARIAEAKTMPHAFGLNVLLAMKSCGANAKLLGIFRDAGIGIDASSTYEADQAFRAEFPADRIAITTQQVYKEPEWDMLMDLVENGASFNACDLEQLEGYGKRRPNTSVGVRLNPGLGSGHSNKTNVGGPSSSFGIWNEYIDQIEEVTKRYNLRIDRIHTHIGSGSDPEVWTRVANMTLGLVEQFPDVTTVDLGGGFKVARMKKEIPTDLKEVGNAVKDSFERFAEKTGRMLELVIEPGTFLTANAGAIVSTIISKCDTGEEGYEFIKVDTGMTENLRPSLYGAQHPLVVVNKEPRDARKKYVVVGHNCESGDILTPQPSQPEAIGERNLQEAEIGDLLVVESTGAYCASMSAKEYNSFPPARSVLRLIGGELVEITDDEIPIIR